MLKLCEKGSDKWQNITVTSTLLGIWSKTEVADNNFLILNHMHFVKNNQEFLVKKKEP